MKRATWAGALGLGALFAVAYPLGTPGYGLYWLSFASLVPLIALCASADSARRACARAAIAGTAANVPLVYWIAYTVAVQGKLGWPAGCLAAFLVSAYLGAYIGAAGFFIHRLRSRYGDGGLWMFPFVWTGLEFARSVLMTGFPWMLFGYTLAEKTVLMQAADLAGVFGLGFLLAASNVCLYQALRRAAQGSFRPALAAIAGSAAIVAFLFAYGSWRMGEFRAAPGAPGLRVRVAQGGIDQAVKWNPAYQRRTLEIYEALSRDAGASGAQVIVWPETAAPFFYGWEAQWTREVDRIAAEARVPLIFGAPWFSPSEGGKYYNSVFLLDGGGVLRGRYDKRHLVPFGEYIPLRTVLFFLKKLTHGAGDFSTGTGPSLFQVPGGPAGASVCYEAVFPEIIRDSVREGARWLVNVTNDAWFGDTVAPRQHLAMARMRSVEFRRPMVRAANAGISALIDARGEVGGELGLFRRGTLDGWIVPRAGMTPYAKTGDLFAISCIIITFLILCFTLRGRDGLRTSGRKIRRARIPLPRAPGLSLK